MDWAPNLSKEGVGLVDWGEERAESKGTAFNFQGAYFTKLFICFRLGTDEACTIAINSRYTAIFF